MRRKDREVVDQKEIMRIIDKCKVCRIAMQDKAGLYIVPMNFGYTYEDSQLVLFFHSAKEGRKISALKENRNVCFEMDCEHQLITADVACAATTAKTIAISAVTGTNTTFALGTATGTPAAGNTKTISVLTSVDNVTGASASVASGSSSIFWTNPSCIDEVMIVAAAGTNTGTPTGNGSA